MGVFASLEIHKLKVLNQNMFFVYILHPNVAVVSGAKEVLRGMF